MSTKPSNPPPENAVKPPSPPEPQQPRSPEAWSTRCVECGTRLEISEVTCGKCSAAVMREMGELLHDLWHRGRFDPVREEPHRIVSRFLKKCGLEQLSDEPQRWTRCETCDSLVAEKGTEGSLDV